MNQAVFTIVSRNYFAYARTLGESVRQSNPQVDFHVLVVDRKDELFASQHRDWQITWVEDLHIDGFLQIAFKYDILELNTNVKPTFAKHLLAGYEKIVYLDPDIFVYASLGRIFQMLDQHAVVLTPHITEPIDDDKLPGEQEFLNAGIFNLGFCAFNNSAESVKLLSWWEKRCHHLAFNEQPEGFFVDQKWMDFAPSLCSTTRILRDPEYNMAYWNLHERSLHYVDSVAHVADSPLVFFHFSGLTADGDDRVSKYQTRFRLSERSDIAPLFSSYRASLEGNGHATYLKIPYSFGEFSDGTPLTSLARRIAISIPDFGDVSNPFEATGLIRQTLEKAGILRGAVSRRLAAARTGTSKASERSRSTKLLSFVFRLGLRILGAPRYERLMRFLCENSNLRRQKFLLPRD